MQSVCEQSEQNQQSEQPINWQDPTCLHRWLCEVGKSYRELDVFEAKLLCAAERVRIWSAYGCVSLFDYLERVLGYSPKVARDRVRIARALEQLPEMAAALQRGDLLYSAVRELTRVAIPGTEREWIAELRGKPLRVVEERVAGHKPGDLPSDPPDPELRLCTVRFEVKPATRTLLRETQKRLQAERGMDLDEDQLLEAMCHAVISGDATSSIARAKYQIAITTCATCKAATQTAGGRTVAIDAATLERAQCDAVRIGSLEATDPARAVQEVPPRVRRFVEHRDGGRCCVPGCRSTRYIELHHVRFLSLGGTHDPENIVLLCDAHHVALHDRKLTITGTAPDQLVFSMPHVGPNLISTAVQGERLLLGPPAVGGVCPLELQRVFATERGRESIAVSRPIEATTKLERGTWVRGTSNERENDIGRGADVSFPPEPRRTDYSQAGSSPVCRSDSQRAPHVGHEAQAPQTNEALRDAKQALISLGFNRSVASSAIEKAIEDVGPLATTEELVRAGLRRCAKPVTRHAPMQG